MNDRERVLTALSHVRPDQVPYDIRFTVPAREKMARYYDDSDFESKLGNCFIWRRPHLPDARFVEVAPNIWQDEFGVQWDRHIDKDIGVVCNRLVRPDNVSDFEFPDPNDPGRYTRFDETVSADGDTAVLVSLGFSLFERAWTLAGMEDVLMAMVTGERWIDVLLDRILEFNLAIIENACTDKVDIFRFGDDWGHQRGVLMGPDLWRRYIKPRFAAMCRAVKRKGKFTMLHCCGKVDELLADLIGCGLDIFNPFQPEVMDVFDVKRTFGTRLSFYGGISIQRTLPFGTARQVRDEVRRLTDVIGEHGGYIASPSHDIPGDAKAENIAAMIEVLQNQ